MLPLMRSRSSVAVACGWAVRSPLTWLGIPALISLKHRDGGADLPRRAIAALIAVMLHESGLHRMQFLRCSQPFDGGDAVALMHDRQREAGINASPIDDHGAGAALAMVAALFRAGEMQLLTQSVEQGGARIQFKLASPAVHRQRNLRHGRQSANGGLRSGCKGCCHHRNRSCSAGQKIAPGQFEEAGTLHDIFPVIKPRLLGRSCRCGVNSS